jgi:hypothetical protein
MGDSVPGAVCQWASVGLRRRILSPPFDESHPLHRALTDRREPLVPGPRARRRAIWSSGVSAQLSTSDRVAERAVGSWRIAARYPVGDAFTGPQRDRRIARKLGP